MGSGSGCVPELPEIPSGNPRDSPDTPPGGGGGEEETEQHRDHLTQHDDDALHTHRQQSPAMFVLYDNTSADSE